jgi:plastocyanin
MTRHASLTLLLLLTVLTLGLAACGGDDEEAATTPTAAETDGGGGGGGGGGTIQITTSEGITYDETSVEASAGEVTIDYTNDSGLPHNVTLEDVDGGATDTIESGSTSVSVSLEPGEYTFFCSVDGHRDQGMVGTLVVN